MILGQDPYHNVRAGPRLCFSVKPDVEIPPSLVNIYQELHDDLGCYIPNNGYLGQMGKAGRHDAEYRADRCVPMRPIPITAISGRSLPTRPLRS